MQAENTHVAVIGAGIVGLAIAERISRTIGDVVVIEQHESFGRETSSRNSQVVHAGLYYPEDTLKAKLCVKGNRMMYEFCEKEAIPFRKTGKLVPGIDAEEVERVFATLSCGKANGAEGVRMLTKKEIDERAPDICCTETLFSPSSGIIDAHVVMATLERKSQNRGAIFAYASRATHMEFSSGTWRIYLADSSGEEVELRSKIVINSTGLHADAVAASAGVDIEQAGYCQEPCKGEYFRVADRERGRMKTLVYPAVVPRMKGTAAEGVHLVLELDGGMKIGPNKIDRMDGLDVDESHLMPFWEQMHRYLPWLRPEDLRPDSAGVRPMRRGGGGNSQDYIIMEESARGLPGLVNLITMESPALTSSLAIADYVASLVDLS
ncbi:MAG: hypothetical protein CMN78_02955 [Spirochaetales bacterium]|nr:hypothetical protein [Spirochaetales bacterium]